MKALPIVLLFICSLTQAQNLQYPITYHRAPVFDTLRIESGDISAITIISPRGSDDFHIYYESEEGETFLMENPSVILTGRGPGSGNFYWGFFFTRTPGEKIDRSIEFFINPNTGLFGVAVSYTHLDKTTTKDTWGEEVLNPFKSMGL